MKILIIKFRHIGDVLLTTPLLANFKTHFPNASIDIAINSDAQGILKDNPHIRRLFPYDRDRIRNLFPLQRAVKEVAYLRNILTENYDLVLNLTEGDRGAIISRLLNSEKRLGIRSRNQVINFLHPYTLSVETLPYRHTVERELEFLEILNLPILSKRVELYSNAPLPSGMDASEYVVIHPVSRWMFKSWRIDRFARIIDTIQSRYGLRVILTGGPSSFEKNYNTSIMQLCKTRPLDLTGKISLQELTTLLRHARAFIGLDTAPMHMAAACDIPVIALFGPSDPVLWGPWENELQRACYTEQKITQQCGKHTVILHGPDRIIRKEGRKISTAMMHIREKEVLEIFEKRIIE